MKYLLLLPIAVITLGGCDKIPPRVPPKPPDCVLNTPIVKTNTLTSDTRKVLLEDYTGHTCGNCPRASEVVEDILHAYPDRVVALASHVSKVFAAPKATHYLEDFRDPASTEWDVFLNMSASSLPKGTVNRMLIQDKYPQNYSAWRGLVEVELLKSQTVKLDITTMYDLAQKLLNVKVFTTFKTALSSNVNILMVITQDSIVADQTDYSPPNGSEVIDGDRRPDYKFDHIMIKSLNGTWGQSLQTAPIAKNDTITITKECNLVSKCFHKDLICTRNEYLNLVVFVYNEATKEVLQVERIRLSDK